jgi:hypothetical protein
MAPGRAMWTGTSVPKTPINLVPGTEVLMDGDLMDLDRGVFHRPPEASTGAVTSTPPYATITPRALL